MPTLSATPLLPLQSMAARAYVLLALALAVSEAQPPGCNQQCGSDADCNRTAVGTCKAYTYCYHTHTIAGNLCFEQPKRYKCAGGGCVEQAGCTSGACGVFLEDCQPVCFSGKEYACVASQCVPHPGAGINQSTCEALCI